MNAGQERPNEADRFADAKFWRAAYSHASGPLLGKCYPVGKELGKEVTLHWTGQPFKCFTTAFMTFVFYDVSSLFAARRSSPARLSVENHRSALREARYGLGNASYRPHRLDRWHDRPRVRAFQNPWQLGRLRYGVPVPLKATWTLAALWRTTPARMLGSLPRFLGWRSHTTRGPGPCRPDCGLTRALRSPG